MEQLDIAIIGGGIAGASAAYEVSTERRVVIIERETHVGYHSTGRSAAVFSETYGNALVRALTSGSRRFYEAPPAGFADHPLLKDLGVLIVARAEEMDRVERIAAELHATSPRIRLVDAAAARAMVPVLRADYVAGGIVKPDVMDIDVHALHQGFLRGARARGARVVSDAEVRKLERDGDGWRIRTRDGEWRAQVVVNASGAWADAVADMAGVARIGLVPKRRTALVFAPPDGFAVQKWPNVVAFDETFYFKPEAGNMLASPCDETPVEPSDVQPDEMDVAVCIDRIQRAANLPVRRVERAWAGLRSFVADRAPVVGFDKSAPGFFWLAGQGGYGIQTAPAMGRVAASLLLGREIPADLRELGIAADALDPGRLARPVN